MVLLVAISGCYYLLWGGYYLLSGVVIIYYRGGYALLSGWLLSIIGVGLFAFVGLQYIITRVLVGS